MEAKTHLAARSRPPIVQQIFDESAFVHQNIEYILGWQPDKVTSFFKYEPIIEYIIALEAKVENNKQTNASLRMESYGANTRINTLESTIRTLQNNMDASKPPTESEPTNTNQNNSLTLVQKLCDTLALQNSTLHQMEQEIRDLNSREAEYTREKQKNDEILKSYPLLAELFARALRSRPGEKTNWQKNPNLYHFFSSLYVKVPRSVYLWVKDSLGFGPSYWKLDKDSLETVRSMQINHHKGQADDGMSVYDIEQAKMRLGMAREFAGKKFPNIPQNCLPCGLSFDGLRVKGGYRTITDNAKVTYLVGGKGHPHPIRLRQNERPSSHKQLNDEMQALVSQQTEQKHLIQFPEVFLLNFFVTGAFNQSFVVFIQDRPAGFTWKGLLKVITQLENLIVEFGFKKLLSDGGDGDAINRAYQKASASKNEETVTAAKQWFMKLEYATAPLFRELLTHMSVMPKKNNVTTISDPKHAAKKCVNGMHNQVLFLGPFAVLFDVFLQAADDNQLFKSVAALADKQRVHNAYALLSQLLRNHLVYDNNSLFSDRLDKSGSQFYINRVTLPVVLVGFTYACSISAVLDTRLTLLQRWARTWYAIYFLRGWYMSNKKTGAQFITPHLYADLLNMSQGLCWEILKYMESPWPGGFHPEMFGSDQNENRYSSVRQGKGGGNLDLKELLITLGKIQYALLLEAQVKTINVKPEKPFNLPSVKVLISLVDKMKALAFRVLESIGVEVDRKFSVENSDPACNKVEPTEEEGEQTAVDLVDVDDPTIVDHLTNGIMTGASSDLKKNIKDLDDDSDGDLDDDGIEAASKKSKKKKKRGAEGLMNQKAFDSYINMTIEQINNLTLEAIVKWQGMPWDGADGETKSNKTGEVTSQDMDRSAQNATRSNLINRVASGRARYKVAALFKHRSGPVPRILGGNAHLARGDIVVIGDCSIVDHNVILTPAFYFVEQMIVNNAKKEGSTFRCVVNGITVGKMGKSWLVGSKMRLEKVLDKNLLILNRSDSSCSQVFKCSDILDIIHVNNQVGDEGKWQCTNMLLTDAQALSQALTNGLKDINMICKVRIPNDFNLDPHHVSMVNLTISGSAEGKPFNNVPLHKNSSSSVKIATKAQVYSIVKEFVKGTSGFSVEKLKGVLAKYMVRMNKSHIDAKK